ncbi:hypothetical protein E2C01_088094 [Portunus trituberculatus]|uniref:Uncharacterized protein n=1 Tax=Portunus trituberculatus TaxID=210409 RepID=A0A5B7J8A5_PORTR|nr:hypothetical protein [Portunus trituberculatus]
MWTSQGPESSLMESHGSITLGRLDCLLQLGLIKEERGKDGGPSKDALLHLREGGSEVGNVGCKIVVAVPSIAYDSYGSTVSHRLTLTASYHFTC